MSLYRLSIERPVLATVFSIVIIIFGVVSYQELGVREFPSVDPPIITVTTTYTGAPAEVIETQITEPLEENINAVAGIRTLTSVSREGQSTITVEFELGVDLETAANDVRDKVSGAQRDLPPDADPPTVSKADADNQPVAFISIYSPQRDLLELTDIADRRFKPTLQTIDGVAEVGIWGEKRFSMRLWLDRGRLASYGLTPVDVRAALDRENVELPSGRIDGQQVEITVRAASRFSRPEEFNAMVLIEREGRVVRLQDVGYAAVGPENQRSLMKRNGVPAIGVVLRPQPGSNQIAIADEMYRRLELIKKDLPEDIETTLGFDTTQYVRQSLVEVQETIFVATALVVVIIFAFLRSWRSTLIPAVVIPVCLVGSFFIMYLAGFSINVLTLLALVLAIGLVVDDAIVVLENIYAKIEQGMPVRQAGIEGTKEVFFAVIATTISLAAVFMPILFLGGLTGELFKEFAIVIAGSVIISAFVALTLTPMLATKILKSGNHSRFYERTERYFVGMANAYQRGLTFVLQRRWIAWVVLVAASGLTYAAYSRLENELAPLEDRARLRVQVTGPEGASYEYMLDYMDRLTARLSAEAPEAEMLISMTSPGFGGSSSVNSGFVRMFMVNRSDRERTQADIAARVQAAANELTGGRAVVVQEPTINVGVGAGSRFPLQFVIQSQSLEKLQAALPRFMDLARQSPVFGRVDEDLKFNKPELRITVDRERAQALGVSARAVGETLGLALAEQRMGYYVQNGKQYYVIGALLREQRDDTLDLRNLYVPSSRGSPVRLDNVVRLEEQISPPRLYRFNRYSSATVSASLGDGYSLGEGVAEMERIAREVLDETFNTDLAGEARDLRDTSSGTLFAFVFALVLIYFVLAAQFESFRDPVAILLTVPLALAGALGSLWMTQQTLNIFSQIGIIMLIGLVTKNGILIVEFANQQRERGVQLIQATLEASTSRFRPVLMTSLSTILGILPIALALGAGSESRRSMGIAVIGGMLLGTLLTLFVIPAMYTLITSKHDRSTAESQTGPTADLGRDPR